MVCKCPNKKPCVNQFWSQFCTTCGRIWVSALFGNLRPTDQYQLMIRPTHDINIGYSFIKDRPENITKR